MHNNPDRGNSLRFNKRFLFLTRLFIEIKALNVVIQLFYLSRSLDLSQIVYLSMIWTITLLLSDLPTSYLADSIGRKKGMIIGILLTSVSILLMFFAQGFTAFAVIYVFNALGYAFFTGSDQAFLYDSLREVGDEGNINKVSGKYLSSASFAKIFIAILGAIIARDLSQSQFNILISLDFVGTIISLYFASKLIEPNRYVDVSKMKIGVFRDSLKLVFSKPVLLKFTMNKILVFMASYLYWRVYQIYLVGVGLEVFYIGLIYFFLQIFLFLGQWYSEKIQKKLGLVKFIIISLTQKSKFKPKLLSFHFQQSFQSNHLL